MSSIWARSAVTAAFSCLSAFLLVNVLGPELTPVVIGDNDFYMKYYYDIHNANARAMSQCGDIVVVDIGDFQSRTDIAAVIDKVISSKPAVVGLDVYMAENDELMADVNRTVVNVLSKAECPFVSPCIFDEDIEEWTYPFYKSEVDTVNHFFASPVAPDMLEQFSIADPRSPKKTFAYVIAEQYSKITGYGIDIYDGFTVNYRNKDFFPISDIEEINELNLAGKIVLIGDCRDYRDIHSLPFKVMGMKSLPGVINNAYVLNSLICSDNYCNDHGYSGLMKKYNAPYHNCSRFLNILLSYILCFLFSLVVQMLSRLDNHKPGLFLRAVFIILPMFLTIIAEMLLLVLCFEIFTSSLMRIPNIFLFMASLLFVTTFDKLVREIFVNN